jgi:hypothetical protein
MSKGCSLKKMSVNVPAFTNTIPPTIRDEIQQVVKNTQRTSLEQSLTFCRLKGRDKIFVSDYSTGNKNETYVMPCNQNHGNAAEKIGDLHTHPTTDPDTVGITPSVADFVSTLEESVDTQIPQISCITSAEAKGIHCYQPKASILKDQEKIKGYKNAVRYSASDMLDIPSYVRENVANDFDHAWFNRKTWERLKNPKAKDVVHDAFINSKKFLKYEDVPNLEKGPFCDVIQDLNNPKDDNVGQECRKALKIREFLGISY